MNKANKHGVLAQAKDSFIKAKYKDALEKFALVLQKFPTSKEAYNGVILSEMAMSGENGAEAIFDYYEILKKDDKQEADEIILDILKNLDGPLNKFSEQFSQKIEDALEYEDGILYKDFKAIIENGSTFKETFQSIIFSTKVIITQKEDFLDFLENLIENGFKDMAYAYIENTISIFPTDKKLLKLIKDIK